MTCDEVLRRIDDDSIPEALRTAIQLHRDSCSSCELAWREAESLDSAMRAMPLGEPDWTAYDRELQERLRDVMPCGEVLERIDDDLLPEPVQAELRLHRGSCVPCDRAWRETEMLDAAIRALPLAEPDWTKYELNLHARLAEEEARRPRRIWWFVATAAAASVLFYAGGLLMNPVVPVTPGPISLQTSPSPAASASASSRFAAAFAEYQAALSGEIPGPIDPAIFKMGPGIWPQLVVKTSAADPRGVQAALAILEELRPSDCVGALERSLGEERWRIDAVLASIARMNLPGSSRALASALGQGGRREAAAVSACGLLPDRDAASLLVNAYPSLSHASRARVHETLKPHAAVVRRMLGVRLPSMSDESIATFAPLATAVDAREFIPALLSLVRAGKYERAAWTALNRLAGVSLVKSILDLPAGDVAEFVRAKGDEGLAELGRLATASPSKTACAAVRLLAQFPDDRSKTALATALTRPPTREEATRSLLQLGDEKSLAVLMDRQPAWCRNVEGAAALGRARSRPLLPRLMTLALDRGTSTQSAVSMLADYPAVEIIPPLIQSLNVPQVRSRAGELLKRLTDEAIPADAEAWSAWWKRHSK